MSVTRREADCNLPRVDKTEVPELTDITEFQKGKHKL